MTPTDLLQAGINEAGGDGWSALLAAPSIRELLRLAESAEGLREALAECVQWRHEKMHRPRPLLTCDTDWCQRMRVALLPALAQPTEPRVEDAVVYRALYDARVREWCRVTEYLDTDSDTAEEVISAIEASRADEPRVAEGLTVEMVAAAFHKAMNHGYHGGGWDHGDGDIAAAILANLPASRPPEPPDLRVTKGPGTFGPDATWTIRTAALKDGWDALVAWLIDHCDEPTPQVWTDEDGETGDVWMWCEGHQVRGPRLGRSDPPVVRHGDEHDDPDGYCATCTPSTPPVADGTVCDGCGHSWEQHAGALGCTFESEQPDWFCACGEMEPTPTPPTDGAA